MRNGWRILFLGALSAGIISTAGQAAVEHVRPEPNEGPIYEEHGPGQTSPAPSTPRVRVDKDDLKEPRDLIGVTVFSRGNQQLGVIQDVIFIRRGQPGFALIRPAENFMVDPNVLYAINAEAMTIEQGQLVVTLPEDQIHEAPVVSLSEFAMLAREAGGAAYRIAAPAEPFQEEDYVRLPMPRFDQYVTRRGPYYAEPGHPPDFRGSYPPEYRGGYPPEYRGSQPPEHRGGYPPEYREGYPPEYRGTLPPEIRRPRSYGGRDPEERRRPD